MNSLYFQALLESENSREFTNESLISFSRKDAYECRIPKTRVPQQYHMRHSNEEPNDICNPLQQRWIPPADLLRHWSDLIRERANISSSHFFIESSVGNYDEPAIQMALRLHVASSVKKNVEKEIDWLARNSLKPNSVADCPSIESFDQYKNLIWSSGPYGQIIGHLGMAPDTLASLCRNEYLSCDHMQWIAQKLNTMQDDALVVYVNEVNNYERFGRRFSARNSQPPRYLILLMNVWRDQNGDVFLGSNSTPGYHFSMCYFEKASKNALYCDSLGWKYPNDVIRIIDQLCVGIYNTNAHGISIGASHDFRLAKGFNHYCDKSKCATFFPLQTCGLICGVVAIVVAVIACLSKPFFDYITKVHRFDAKHVPHMYLSKPTQYARYLRRVIMAWMADDVINIECIVPELFINGENRNPNVDGINANIDSDTDSEPDTVRVNFSVEGNDQKKTPNVKNVASAKKDGKLTTFKCQLCSFETQRKFNLQRHVQSQHRSENTNFLKDLDKGNSLCLECGLRFHKTNKLREHLKVVHKMPLRMETLHFENDEG